MNDSWTWPTVWDLWELGMSWAEEGKGGKIETNVIEQQ